jgi:hypothetical protein
MARDPQQTAMTPSSQAGPTRIEGGSAPAKPAGHRDASASYRSLVLAKALRDADLSAFLWPHAGLRSVDSVSRPEKC